PTGTSGFGNATVYGLRRVPRPPAKITARFSTMVISPCPWALKLLGHRRHRHPVRGRRSRSKSASSVAGTPRLRCCALSSVYCVVSFIRPGPRSCQEPAVTRGLLEKCLRDGSRQCTIESVPGRRRTSGTAGAWSISHAVAHHQVEQQDC